MNRVLVGVAKIFSPCAFEKPEELFKKAKVLMDEHKNSLIKDDLSKPNAAIPLLSRAIRLYNEKLKRGIYSFHNPGGLQEAQYRLLEIERRHACELKVHAYSEVGNEKAAFGAGRAISTYLPWDEKPQPDPIMP
ncbi:MAG: hypothetical protein WC717_02720 [Candidatus Micrarchaeia archaeon]|jgi:hypothetical protein